VPDHRFIDAEMAIPELTKRIAVQTQTKRSADRGPNLVRLELAPMNVVPQRASDESLCLFRGNARPFTHGAKEKLIVVKDQHVAEVEEDRLDARHHSFSALFERARIDATER